MNRKSLKNLFSLLIVIALSTMVYSFVLVPVQNEWVVPEQYKTMKNPTDKTDKENIGIGKGIFNKNCKSCHGEIGKNKALPLDPSPGDPATGNFVKDNDGELFYKIEKGRGQMPSFEKKFEDKEDIWLIIDYIRSKQK